MNVGVKELNISKNYRR